MEDAAHKDHEGEDGFDPHIWTSPLNAFKIAENIYRGLVFANPEEVEIYRKNYLELLRGIAKLDEELWKRSKSVRGMKFLVFHPAWSYFARDYGLIQVPVEQEGKEPKGAQLSRLIEDAKKEGIKVLFVSPQHSKRSAKTIADAIGAKIVEIDPLSKKWDEKLKVHGRNSLRGSLGRFQDERPTGYLFRRRLVFIQRFLRAPAGFLFSADKGISGHYRSKRRRKDHASEADAGALLPSKGKDHPFWRIHAKRGFALVGLRPPKHKYKSGFSRQSYRRGAHGKVAGFEIPLHERGQKGR